MYVSILPIEMHMVLQFMMLSRALVVLPFYTSMVLGQMNP